MHAQPFGTRQLAGSRSFDTAANWTISRRSSDPLPVNSATVCCPFLFGSPDALRWTDRGHVRMLRITIEDKSKAITLKLKGRLVGPWVPELEKLWKDIVSQLGDKGLIVD